MSRLLSIIAALVVLSIFVTVHELGHFIVGRLLKFRITGFSIGMGPVLFGREKNGTLFAVRAFPIGGMCQFYGEDSESGSGEGFNDHPVWKRFLVVLAGPVMNLLLALILSVAALSAYGNYMPQIAEIMEDSPVQVDFSVINDVDRALYPQQAVVTGDAIILDHCGSWFNLVRRAIAAELGAYPFVEILKPYE